VAERTLLSLIALSTCGLTVSGPSKGSRNDMGKHWCGKDLRRASWVVQSDASGRPPHGARNAPLFLMGG
jgi:hypothetical protein